MHRFAGILGIVAILAMLGLAGFLPPVAAFLLSALAVILFPGIVVVELLTTGATEGCGLPERLAIWFVAGTGILAAAGFAGLLAQLRLDTLVTIVTICYVLATVLVFARGRTGGPEAGRVPAFLERTDFKIVVALFSVAICSALLTMVTGRCYDDWYYLAYIKDYVAGKPLGAEDAIFNMGHPAPSRIWFGGGWWVLEAMLSRISDIDPIDFHQVYLPLLTVPFAVLACFMLSARIFKSRGLALFACCTQVLFYLSSAFPYKSAGWVFFARMAHDKSVACFVVAPVAAALAIRFIGKTTERNPLAWRPSYCLYGLAIMASVLVHGMGPIWCGLLVGPFVLSSWFIDRARCTTRDTVMLLLPFLVLGAALLSARGLVAAFIQAPQPVPTGVPDLLDGIYLPGNELRPPTETWHPVVWAFRKHLVILSPLFVTRYPLGIAGLVFSLAMLAAFRSSRAARFLTGATLLMLLLAYTPPGTALSAQLMTSRLIFRLTWLLPWGLVITYVLSRLNLRPFALWLVLAGIALALARGNPYNYASSLIRTQARNRPPPEAAASFSYLASEPSPLGGILASEQTGRMIAAFLPDAYPVNFREFGPVGRDSLAATVRKKHIDNDLTDLLRTNSVRYILIENKLPLAIALRRSKSGFVLKHENSIYSTWQVCAGPDTPAPAAR